LKTRDKCERTGRYFKMSSWRISVALFPANCLVLEGRFPVSRIPPGRLKNQDPTIDHDRRGLTTEEGPHEHPTWTREVVLRCVLGLRAGYLLVKDGEAEHPPVLLRSESPRRVDAATSRDISLGTWRRVTRLNLDLHPTSASWDPRTLVHRHIDVQQNILRPLSDRRSRPLLRARCAVVAGSREAAAPLRSHLTSPHTRQEQQLYE
jgi:hypothetical protein